MRESTKMVVVLTVIAVISGVVLSQVYDLTYNQIQTNKARVLEGSIFEVLPGAVDMRVIESRSNLFVTQENVDVSNPEPVDSEPFRMYQGLDANGQSVGFTYISEASGYGGLVRVMIGIDDITQTIAGIAIIEHGETPGLGSRIENEDFRNQFVGLGIEDPIDLGQDIDNISGATVSTKAVVNAVKKDIAQAIQAYEEAK